jgi:hypothetical protein|tara:strand:+ start:521 stop:694 length:174 start_codon:yes stop_codon:yes gene_type:complete
MTEFNPDSYENMLMLYNEPSMEDEENYVPYLFGAKYLWYGYKVDACDNLENIIKDEM